MANRRNLKNLIKLIDIEANDIVEDTEVSFLNDLKRSIELTDTKNSRKPSQTYKPSSMKCIRNMYYQVTGREPDEGETSYTLVGICQSGSNIHDWIQGAISQMKDNGFDCEYLDVAEFIKDKGIEDIQIVAKQGHETKLYHTKLNMSFLTDGIIRYKGNYYITEFKTETSRKWQTRFDVDPKHYEQAIAYSLAFGLDDVLFVYIQRDILDMKSYMFHVTDDMRNNLIAKIDECNKYVELNEVPPKPYQTKALCNYCPYMSSCISD